MPMKNNTTTTTHTEVTPHEQITMFFPELQSDERRIEEQSGSIISNNSNINNSQQSGIILYESTSYPVTTLLLWVIHILYVFEWRKSKRRRGRYKRPTITYSHIVEKWQFYRWWIAIFTQYNSERFIITTTTTNSDGHTHPDLSVAMGNADDNDHMHTNNRSSWRNTIYSYIDTVRQRIPNEYINSPTSRRIQSLISYIHNILLLAGGRCLLLMLYNSHLLWSTRALEVHYSNQHQQQQQNMDGGNNNTTTSIFSYIRVVICISLWGTFIELWISTLLLKFLTPSPPQSSSTISSEETSMTLLSLEEEVVVPDYTLLKSLRKKLRHRNLGTSLTMITSALITLYRFIFPFVPLSIIPVIPISYWISIYPALSYVIVMIILYYVALSVQGGKANVWSALLSGSMTGLLWGTGWLDFCSEPYWGSALIILIISLTILSIKVKKPNQRYLAWIDYVGWDNHGRITVYDEQIQEWIPEEQWLTTYSSNATNSSGTGATGDNISDTDDESDDDNDIDDDSAFPILRDEEIDGLSPAANEMEELGSDEEEDDDWVVATPGGGGSGSSSPPRQRRQVEQTQQMMRARRATTSNTPAS